jgi:hypothetical protein
LDTTKRERPSISRIGQCAVVAWALVFGSVSWAQAEASVGTRCSAVSDGTARLACYDNAFPPAAAGKAVAALPATASTALAKMAESSADFGLTESRKPSALLQSVDSQIKGAFDGWEPSTRWTLANGQVWAIEDGSRSAYRQRTGPAVKLKRGTFGGFFIEIEGVSQSPRVRRID